MENIREQLKQFGLQGSEISVYLYLLEHGVSSPPGIASGTGMARPNCYVILEMLIGKGLVSAQHDGKRKRYFAQDPEVLFARLDEKKEVLRHILPDLHALALTQSNKPVVKFYEGFASVKEIYWQTLSAQRVYGIGSTKSLSELDPVFYKKYLSALRDKEIAFTDILSPESGGTTVRETRELLKGFYSEKLLPQKCVGIPTDILIWDDTIALISLTEPIFGTVLHNAQLAKTFRIIFDTLFKLL